ncbi:Penicillin-binding protein 4* (PBP 4*) (PBP 4A) (Penicillin-binding protein E), partial [Durusdinium trenchii]
PVTAVAILKLVESGKLSLIKIDPVRQMRLVVENLEHLVIERQREITIRHLLQHRGGWDRNASFDAMFRSVAFANELGLEPPAEPDAIIRVMLGKPLDFTPGERYAYSNYGYCLLGRVIEKLTGQAYVDFVRSAILEPVGIESMTIGGTRLSDRLAKEVCYYDPARGESVFADDLGATVCHPYGAWYLEAMDSHGGWIASAVDLARFACALDETSPNRLLDDEMLAECYVRPEGLAGFDDEGNPLPRYYGLGWSIRTDEDGNRSATHDGSLPGTNTRLWRRGDGLNVAVLFNTRVSPYGSRVVPPLMERLTPAIEGIEQWPESLVCPEVINGASDLLHEIFGKEGDGYHARSALGFAALPTGAAVEIEAIFEIVE